MTESKLKYIEAENFMSIESGRVEFDDRNIIGLCGYNDSGKSAMTRLLEVLFYNAYPSDQAKFIKDDADYWRGEIGFDDGVVIKRFKYLDGKSAWEMYKDGKQLYTNRLDNGGVAAMSDTPEVIAKYLGVIQDEFTEEKLNVRRNTDKLFLINTTGGDNYKILNSVLQSDTLAEASRQLNEDKNKLNSEVNNLKTTREVIQGQLEAMDVVPTDVMEDLEGKVKDVENIGGNLARLSMLAESKNALNAIVVQEELKPIDLEPLRLLQTIAVSYNACNKPVVEEVSSIDTDRLRLLQQIAQLRQSMFVPMYDELSVVNMDKFADIKAIGALYNALYNVNMQVYNIEQELNNSKEELARLSTQYNFKICKQCGSVVA